MNGAGHLRKRSTLEATLEPGWRKPNNRCLLYLPLSPKFVPCINRTSFGLLGVSPSVSCD